MRDFCKYCKFAFLYRRFVPVAKKSNLSLVLDCEIMSNPDFDYGKQAEDFCEVNRNDGFEIAG
jgi:hypothetical protein